MMRSLKNKGALKNAHPTTIKTLKNIEQTIIAEFKTNFYQGVFYGFSK